MTSPPTPQGVNLLKELLFDREARRLDELSQRIDAESTSAADRTKALADRIDIVFERAGTEERLLHSVSLIIDGALREAEVTRHEPLSKAIAPLIVQTIKTQLRDSQDEMVDALYPITGRLVKSYVQAEINKRMIEINARLGGGRPALDAISAATGVPVGDLALAEANRLAVEEVFLVRRGSGEMLAHWEKPEPDISVPAAQRPGGSNRDVLISGYISGIMSFSEEAFGANPGSFRTLELENGERIFVRGSPAHLLAVRCRGNAGASAEQVIDEVFLDTLERYQQILSADSAMRRADGSGRTAVETQNQTRHEIAAILPALSKSIEKQTAERQTSLAVQSAAPPAAGFARLYALAALVVTPFLIWGGWSAYVSFQTLRTESAANRVLETVDEVRGIPPKIEVERGGRALTITGFVPTIRLRDQILSRLGQEVPQANVRNHLAVLPPGSAELEATLAELRRDAEQQRVEASAATVTRTLARIRQRLQPAQAMIVQVQNRTQRPSAILVDLGKSLEVAIEKAAAAGADPEAQNQLDALWQALTQAEAQLAAVMGMPSPAISRGDARPPGRLELTEDCSLMAERIGAVALGLALPTEVTTLAAKVERFRLPTARDELEKFVRTTAIFFDNGADVRDANSTAATLDQLARQLRDNPDIVLRVVGYTDERGGQAINTNLAQMRADRVAALLIDRGVASGRLVAVGRLAGKDLTRTSGTGSANRRVEFELGFSGETNGAP